MEQSNRTAGALLEKANSNIGQLLRRFENLIALAPDQGDRNSGAVETYQLEIETNALVKAAEELTSLTRSLKEAWLFGQLDTLEDSNTTRVLEDHVKQLIETFDNESKR